MVEDIYDTALIDLAPILINIAKEGGDLRKGYSQQYFIYILFYKY